MRYLPALITLVLVLPSWAEAQGRVQIFPGDRVRVTAPDCQLEKQPATFVSLQGDLLSATIEETEIQCPVEALTRLEVSLGDREWHKASLRGMKYGALLGLVVGGVIVASADLDNDSPAVDAFLAVAGLSATGFLVGTGVGAMREREEWLEAPLPRPRPWALAAGGGRISIGLSVQFRD
ncbi:MAG: hypothetical protein HKO65_15795 [Gemmatimonadetes bacterium]|nr:hypothetical protein [Gemmatimonadota bacterium]